MSRPAAFARARLEIGSAFAAAYLAMGLLAVPMLLLAPLNLAADRTRTTLLAEALAESEYPKLAEAGRAMLVDVQGRAEPGLLAMACGTTCFSAMYPLVMAVAGMLLWLALRAQGLKPEFARTVAAGILISGLLLLGFYPASATVSLLGAVAPLASLLPGLALGVAAFALGCRATGAALGFSGWRICLAWLMLGTVGCAACCCCCGALGLLAGASA